LAPGDNLTMSNMYSLLNYIASSNKELYEPHSGPQTLSSGILSGSDHMTLHSVESGLRNYSDDERRLISISTIGVVARLALEFKQEAVCVCVIAAI